MPGEIRMKICLLTYDAPHQKTSQVFLGLWNAGVRDVDFLLTPFKQRPKREVLFSHRPDQFTGPDPKSLAKRFGRELHSYSEWHRLVDQYDHFVVCGSNLIEADFANSGKILNAHAGLIPCARGLDSFKWAILKGYPLGNTLHVIDSGVDAGRVLAHLPTPVFEEDDLTTLARRHYDNEIWMLANFLNLMSGPTIEGLKENEPTKRMPKEIESQMVQAFDSYKRAASTVMAEFSNCST